MHCVRSQQEPQKSSHSHHAQVDPRCFPELPPKDSFDDKTGTRYALAGALAERRHAGKEKDAT